MTADGRVALVTGAAGGLGRALVTCLTEAGWAVAAATHRDGPFSGDLSDSELVRSLVARVVDRHGRLDLLVANHAAMSMAPVEDHPMDDWWRIVDTNLSGSFYLARSAVPHLEATGGSIVFVASEWGITGWPNASAYAASKAGLVGLTKALARELAPTIRVNAIAPGIIDTDQLKVDATAAGIGLDEMKRRYAQQTPLGRIAQPAEIAASVVFLASSGAAFYTGQILQPNGGSVMA